MFIEYVLALPVGGSARGGCGPKSLVRISPIRVLVRSEKNH